MMVYLSDRVDMMTSEHRKPTEFVRISGIAFGLSLISLIISGLAFLLPSLDPEFRPPLSQGLPLIASWAICMVGLVTGMVAAWAGGRGLDAVIRSRGELTGGGFSFFAVLIGLLSIAISAVLAYARLYVGSPF